MPELPVKFLETILNSLWGSQPQRFHHHASQLEWCFGINVHWLYSSKYSTVHFWQQYNFCPQQRTLLWLTASPWLSLRLPVSLQKSLRHMAPVQTSDLTICLSMISYTYREYKLTYMTCIYMYYRNSVILKHNYSLSFTLFHLQGSLKELSLKFFMLMRNLMWL